MNLDTIPVLPARITTTPVETTVCAVTPRGVHVYYRADNKPAAQLLIQTLEKLPGWKAYVL